MRPAVHRRDLRRAARQRLVHRIPVRHQDARVPAEHIDGRVLRPDVDTLQQAALLLEKTVISQQTTIARLKAENARLRGETVPAQRELDLLKEQLEALKRKVFAPSSEKRSYDGPSSGPASKEPRRGHGPKDQPLLPIATVTHTLPEDERTCPICQGHLEPMGEQTEDSEEITVVEASYQVVTHKRQKYRCACNASVVTAP